MNRRNFLGVAGTAAALGGSVAGQDPLVASPRARIDLNGSWKKAISGTIVGSLAVPSSRRPSGSYELVREIVLPRLGRNECAVLHFDAITYFARVSVNGTELGAMDPYVPYEFDITRSVRERSNIVSVHLKDLPGEDDHEAIDQLELGVNPGWEAYGGIIRDVWIEVRPSTYIDNAQLRYKLGSDFRVASCNVRFEVQSNAELRGKARVTVSRAKSVIASASEAFSVAVGKTNIDVPLQVASPALWSPASPDLYEVALEIDTSKGTDEFSFRTGFRQFRVRETRFELNGELIQLTGVCRHDMWKDQGFTLTHEQMRHDMQAIKGMGLNFIRLVHYPHHRYIVELADELGILVTEEPGYWGVDFTKMRLSMMDLGVRILERTIRRDWNSPSVMAWLVANESNLTLEYLNKAITMCRQVDSQGRLISAANNMSKEKAKPIFEQAGLDFFDDHPYTFEVNEFEKIASFYGSSRPLMFTEWGGREIGQQEQVMSHTVDAFIEMGKTNRLAGTAFWSWQDLPQFSRIDEEMEHGILESGVVTESREPRDEIVMELRRLCEGRSASEPVVSSPEILPLRNVPWAPGRTQQIVDLDAVIGAAEQLAAWKEFETICASYWANSDYARNEWDKMGRRFRLWREAEVKILGVPFWCSVVDGFVRPVVVTPKHSKVTLPIKQKCSGIHILGHISCPNGYPGLGEIGEPAAMLQIQPDVGENKTLPLRNGYEVARGNMIYSSSRVDPITTKAQRAIQFSKQPAREIYQVLLYSVLVENRFVESVSYELQGESQPILVFAVNAEIA
jgi:hypothetical protein